VKKILVDNMNHGQADEIQDGIQDGGHIIKSSITHQKLG